MGHRARSTESPRWDHYFPKGDRETKTQRAKQQKPRSHICKDLNPGSPTGMVLQGCWEDGRTWGPGPGTLLFLLSTQLQGLPSPSWSPWRPLVVGEAIAAPPSWPHLGQVGPSESPRTSHWGAHQDGGSGRARKPSPSPAAHPGSATLGRDSTQAGDAAE